MKFIKKMICKFFDHDYSKMVWIGYSDKYGNHFIDKTCRRCLHTKKFVDLEKTKKLIDNDTLLNFMKHGISALSVPGLNLKEGVEVTFSLPPKYEIN